VRDNLDLRPPPPPPLEPGRAAELLAACDVREAILGVVPCAGGVTNANFAVTLAGGRRVLLRVYHWPHQEPDLERGRKEAFLHELLGRAGVAVPRVHGVAANGECVVLEWIDGERLRDIAPGIKGIESAWEEAGLALRRAHELPPLFDRAGVIVGDHLEPFEQPWGEFHASLIRAHARKLRALERISGAQLARVDAVSELASRALGHDARVRLLHNDPHAANILVRSAASGWQLAAWLDWEYAWMGDPEWDLARFDVFTRAQVGGVNDGFWRGYGARPDPARHGFYELHVMVWFGSLSNPRPSSLTEAARVYVADLDRHLDVLSA